MQFTTKSGARVVITQASFSEAMALKNAVASEISKSGISLDLKGGLSETNIDIADLMRVFFQIDSSQNVQAALFQCLARCLRNGEKVTFDTFEETDARADYYEIIFACARENLTPFFSGLLSELGKAAPALVQADTQK